MASFSFSTAHIFVPSGLNVNAVTLSPRSNTVGSLVDTRDFPKSLFKLAIVSVSVVIVDTS